MGLYPYEGKEGVCICSSPPPPRSGVLRWAGRGADVGLQVSALRLAGAQRHQHLCGWSHLHCRACMLAPELKEALRAQQMEWGAGTISKVLIILSTKQQAVR